MNPFRPGCFLTCCWLAVCVIIHAGRVEAQPAMSAEARARADSLARLSELDHRDMMQQLGIRALRPGANGWAKPGEPDAANYDEGKANPFVGLPDALTLRSGENVTSAHQWWDRRRPEIAEDLEREIYGRIPAGVPAVRWEVTGQTDQGYVAGTRVIGKQLAGHVDNTSYPALRVDIRMTLVTPAEAKGPVPVLMMFGWWGFDLPGPDTTGKPETWTSGRKPNSMEQLISAGWGYAMVDPSSIQADNGAGLTGGIIGLVNQGKRRKPDDWGALRAWSWGAARALDYLETVPAVDARRVGIEGVSRYGKAALVTMAFEPRFAVALIGSSGKGGTVLHRRNFGETVENLAGSGAYHWLAGNYLKYAAEEATFGRKTAEDLPVDAHELITLCAPRPVFVSYGIPEKGDALWVDQKGSFMAVVAASPVYELLGGHGIEAGRDPLSVELPPVNTGLLDGELAWRQHDGGHEDQTNMSSFIQWANRVLVEKNK